MKSFCKRYENMRIILLCVFRRFFASWSLNVNLFLLFTNGFRKVIFVRECVVFIAILVISWLEVEAVYENDDASELDFGNIGSCLERLQQKNALLLVDGSDSNFQIDYATPLKKQNLALELEKMNTLISQLLERIGLYFSLNMRSTSDGEIYRAGRPLDNVSGLSYNCCICVVRLICTIFLPLTIVLVVCFLI